MNKKEMYLDSTTIKNTYDQQTIIDIIEALKETLEKHTHATFSFPGESFGNKGNNIKKKIKLL